MSAMFTSPTVYYTGSRNNIFYKDQTTSTQPLGLIYSIVYSSEMKSTSCYSMAPITTPTQNTMTILASTITQISSSIYEPSSATFNNDTEAFATLDINRSKLT